MSAAVAFPSRPSPQRLVNDLAGIFTSAQVNDLEHRLVALDDSTSNQLVVLTVADLEGYSPAGFATKIGIDWGIGSNDFNNGIVLLVKPKTEDSGGKVSIQVGYGLEGAIPDAYCRRIIENDMIPHFREGDYYGGVSDAVDILSALASGEITEPRDSSDEEDSPAVVMAVLLLFLFIVWVLLRHGGRGGHGGSGGGGRYSTRKTSSPDIFFGPGPGSFGGSSGGGFSGGSSGGSFGGFGGGSFGGGGVSGSW